MPVSAFSAFIFPGIDGCRLSQNTRVSTIPAAKTPSAGLTGLRVYLTEGDTLPVDVFPPRSPRKYWTRRGIAEWLAEKLAADEPTHVGIDHDFSFPLRYFEVHELARDFGPLWSLAMSANAAVIFPPTELPATAIRLPSASRTTKL